MKNVFNFVKRHKMYFCFLLFIGFVFSFWNLVSYTYSLYVTETKDTYDVRELQIGDTIPFGAYLTGEFHATYFVDYGYGLGTNSVDSFNILYCEDADCTDGYVVADSFTKSYKVKDYVEIFEEENKGIKGWSVNLLEIKKEGYSNYAYSSQLEKDIILYPSNSDNCCCENGVEKLYNFVKLVPTSKTTNWTEDDVLSFETIETSYTQDVSVEYNFTADEPGILRFLLLTNMMDVVVTVNDKEILYTDYDYIYENRDTYYAIQYNVETAGDYELKIYLDEYNDSAYMNYINIKDVMFLTETEDTGKEDKDIMILTSCTDGKTCVLSGSLVKDEVETPEEKEEVANPETIDMIFVFLTLSLIFGIGLVFFSKKIKA